MTQKTIQSQKSNLAKLLATENITVLQNQVQTASFDVKDRVLTIPFFKHNDNNVVDPTLYIHLLKVGKRWQTDQKISDPLLMC